MPEKAVRLADYLLAPKKDREFPSKRQLAMFLDWNPSALQQMQSTHQFERYLNFRREQEGLDQNSMIEAARMELWRRGMDGDSKALEQYLRMEGEFAAEKHEIVHTNATDMTTEDIQEELDRILAGETQ